MNASTPSPIATAPAASTPELDSAVAHFLALALPPAESALLRLCFGLDGTPSSLAAAARRLGLRPAMALRLERRAMRALRRASLELGEEPPTD